MPSQSAVPEAGVAHRWVMFGPGDYPRWTRYKCKGCAKFAQYHDSGTIEGQTKDDCTPKPSPESVARFKASQAKREGK